MKKLSALLLSLLLALTTACAFSPADDAAIGVIGGADGPTAIIVTGPDSWLDQDTQTDFDLPVEYGEYYYDLETVILYLEYYNELPDNYITKDYARSLGWNGGVPEYVMEGAAIGGDAFGNREGLLPAEEGRDYYECDLNTLGADSRGAERLVFSSDGLYFHTEDHYDSFTEYYVTVEGEVKAW